jgi:rod shape-determining protein MreC
MRDGLAHWLAAVLLVGQFALLVSQIPEAERHGSRFERLALELVGPLAGAVATAADTGREGLGALRTRDALWRENEQLRTELAAARQRLLALEAGRLEPGRLAGEAPYVPRPTGTPRPTDVVYIDHLSWLRSLVVYAGPRGARVNQPVVAAGGLVGRVVVPSGPWAKVQLVTDRAAAVGAMLERTRRQGVVRGAGAGELELDYIPVQAEVVAGDRVVTSGVDGVYPRGILIGVVREVLPGGGLFHTLPVAPAVDLGRLDLVYLLDLPEPPDALLEAEARP